MSQISILVAAEFIARTLPTVAFNGLCVEELVGNLGALHEKLATMKPAILLLDIDFPALDPIEGVRGIHRRSPATRIIVLSAAPTATQELSVLKQGAMGYCYSGATPDLLLKAIRKVDQGEIWFERKSIASLIGELYGSTEKARSVRNDGFGLTAREWEILELLSGGTSNKEIAAVLHVAPATVKAHLTHIFRKTGVSDRLRLALLARDTDLNPSCSVCSSNAEGEPRRALRTHTT